MSWILLLYNACMLNASNEVRANLTFQMAKRTITSARTTERPSVRSASRPSSKYSRTFTTTRRSFRNCSSEKPRWKSEVSHVLSVVAVQLTTTTRSGSLTSASSAATVETSSVRASSSTSMQTKSTGTIWLNNEGTLPSLEHLRNILIKASFKKVFSTHSVLI